MTPDTRWLGVRRELARFLPVTPVRDRPAGPTWDDGRPAPVPSRAPPKERV
jgi:hypothetical protein